MKVKAIFLSFAVCALAASPVFASGVNLNFNFGGAGGDLGTSTKMFTSGAATITAYGYRCSASNATTGGTLSNCTASNLFQKVDGPDETGLGLTGEANGNEIGFDGADADFVMGLDVSQLFHLGATSMTLTFGSVEAGEAFAVLGYGSNPFLKGTSFVLDSDNTKAWVGNDGAPGNSEVLSATFHLNSDDEFLVLIAPCGASMNPDGPCGSNVTLESLSAQTPEPGTIALFGTGLLLLGIAVRRKRTAALAS